MAAFRLLIIVAILLQGCGQTGPLMYPGQEPTQPEASPNAPPPSPTQQSQQ